MKNYTMPDPGEGLTEAEVVSWRVAVGDTVAINDVLCEVETAKSIVELPSPYAGTVTALVAAEGQTVPVGAPLVTIDDGSEPEKAAEELLVGHIPAAESGRRRRRRGSAGAAQTPAVVVESPPEPATHAERVAEPPRAERVAEPPRAERVAEPPRAERPVPPRMDATEGPAHVLAKPPARRLAAELGVDLATVTGTGRDGVVTRTDVKAAASRTVASPPAVPAAGAAAGVGGEFAVGQSVVSRLMLGGAPTGPGERRTPIQGVRKVTAKAVKESIDTKALVTSFLTCDVTATMDFVSRMRQDKAFKGLHISPLTVWCKAVTLAMRRTPVINASWDDATGEIVHHEQVNLGIAAATPRGLMVPVLRGAQEMTLVELATELTRLIAVAKEGALQPADYSGGTFSITNVGVFGLDAGTPVVNRQESAILVLGAISRRPWVVGEGEEERVVPRWVTTMSLGFDHRLIDGEQGSVFLRDVAQILSDPSSALLY